MRLRQGMILKLKTYSASKSRQFFIVGGLDAVDPTLVVCKIISLEGFPERIYPFQRRTLKKYFEEVTDVEQVLYMPCPQSSKAKF